MQASTDHWREWSPKKFVLWAEDKGKSWTLSPNTHEEKNEETIDMSRASRIEFLNKTIAF